MIWSLKAMCFHSTSTNNQKLSYHPAPKLTIKQLGAVFRLLSCTYSFFLSCTWTDDNLDDNDNLNDNFNDNDNFRWKKGKLVTIYIFLIF